MAAVPSVAFPIKGSDNNTYSAQTIPVDANGAVPVSAATLPLPSGAATDSTLQAIKSALLAQIDFANVIVQDSTNAYFVRRESLNEGTGTYSVTFETLAGAPGTPTGAVTPVATASGGARVVETALFDATASGTGYASGDVIARVLVYDTAANTIVASYWHDVTSGAAIASAPAAGNLVEQVRNLPAGAATSALQTSGNTTLSSILTTLQLQRSESLWTDDTSNYFVRVEIGGVLSWTDLSGNTVSAPATGARPAAGSTVLLSRSSFQAIAAGTGYSVNDYLDHFVTTDPSSGAVLGNFWVDLTAGAKLTSAPAAANISPVAALPSGAATSALQTTGNTALTALGADGGLATVGLKADTAPASPTASGSVVGVLKGIWAALVGHLPLDTNSNLKTVLYDSTGAAVTYGGTTSVQGVAGGVAVPVSGTFFQATQPVSAAALPLPAGASQDGTDATGVTPPTGAVGIRGWLSGIYAALTGTVKVTTPTPATIVASKVSIATTGTAVQLPSNALVNGLVITASPYNAAQSSTYSGAAGGSGTTTTWSGAGYPLAPGASASFAISNSNTVYVNGTAGDVFSFEGN